MNKGRQKMSSYSQLGKKLLAECIDKHGYTILYDCWLTTKTLKRMVKKWLTWREMDLVISLLWLEEVSTVYIKKREYNLLQSIFWPALELFSWKIMMLLSLRIIHSQINHSFYTTNTYEKAFFDSSTRSERYYLDRRFIFDPIVFFICELYKATQKLSDDGLEELFDIDFCKTNKKLPLLVSRLPKKTKLDRLYVKVKWSRKDISWPTIRKEILRLYQLVKEAFTANHIEKIQAYCIEKSNKYVYPVKEFKYNNFAKHRDQWVHTKIPNLLLAEYREACLRIYRRK